MRRLKSHTTFLQLISGFAPVILGIFLASFGIIYYMVNDVVKSEVMDNLTSISSRHANQIENHVSHMFDDMEMLVNRDRLIPSLLKLKTTYESAGMDSRNYEAIEESIASSLKDYVRINKYYDLFIINLDGHIIYTVKKEADLGTSLKTGPYKDSQLGKLYRKALNSGKVSISQFGHYEPSNEIAGFIAGPIISDNEIQGVIALQINTDKFLKVVQDYSGLQETGETVVATKVGDEALFIAPLRFDPEASIQRTILLGSPDGLPIQRAVQKQFGQGFSTDYRGKEIIAVWSYLPSLDWGMVVKIDKLEAFLPVQKIQNVFVKVSIALVVLILLIAFLLWKSIPEEISYQEKFPPTQEGELEFRTIPSDDEKFRQQFIKEGSLATKIISSNLIPLVFMGILGFVSYSTIQFSTETNQWTDHTYQVLKQALKIEKMMVDLETGQRGFLITGKEQFLEPYNNARNKIASLIEETTNLVSDNPSQVERMNEIRQLVNRWIDSSGTHDIELRRKVNAGEAKFEEVSDRVSTEGGKKISDEFRLKMQVFKGVEYSLMKVRKEKEFRSTNLTKQVIILGTIGIILLASLIAYLISKVISRPILSLVQTAEKVSQGDLSIRVQKITKDEIGSLSNSFNQMLDGLQNEMKARQEVQMKLEEITRKNELILDSAGEGIYGLDKNGFTMFVNPAAEKLLGYDKEEMLGKFMHDLIHYKKSNREPFPFDTCPTHSSLTGGIVSHSDSEVFWKKDGTSFSVEYVSTPQYENGKIVGCVVLFRDITEIKKAREDKAFLAAIIEGTNQGVIGKDLNGTILSWNKGAEKIYGYSSDEIVGKKIHTIISEDRYGEVESFFSQIKKGVKIDHYETVRVRKDGTKIYVLLTISPILDINGDIVGASTLASEITEEKKMREALKEQLIVNKTITDNAASCLFMMDKQGHATFMNPAAGKVTGYTLDEIREMPLHDAIHYKHPDGSSYPMSECPIDNAQVDLEKVVDYEDVFVHKDGSLFPVICYIEPLEKDGEVIGSVLEFKDITERKRAEEELKAKTMEIERFTYTVSHDLKSPLITIGSFLGFLKEDLAEGNNENIEKDINHIVMAAEKMKNLLDELLEFSRIGRLGNTPEVVSVTEMAMQACILIEGTIKSREVEMEITPDMPKIKCDRPRMEEVLQNLIENAIKFMGDQPEPRISIGYKKEENRIVYFVRDNGEGIEPEYQDRIFRIFEKLVPSIEGTGIGLSIVKRVVEVHGGSIWLESEGMGKGSTFYFTFPENIQLKEESNHERR